MPTYVFDSRLVTANVAKYDIWGGGGSGWLLADFGIQMKTATPSLLGTLLTTVEYTDGTGTANQLNLALLLTAGNVSIQPYPVLWYDQLYPISLTYQYLVPGGTCQVDIEIRL